MIGFVWLLVSGIRVLYYNFRYGDPNLLLINRFLLAYFVTEAVLFFAVFGALSSQLVMFLGIVGLSVSLNGGVCRKPATVRQAAQPLPMGNPALA